MPRSHSSVNLDTIKLPEEMANSCRVDTVPPTILPKATWPLMPQLSMSTSKEPPTTSSMSPHSFRRSTMETGNSLRLLLESSQPSTYMGGVLRGAKGELSACSPCIKYCVTTGCPNICNNKCIFNKRTIKACVSCSWWCPATHLTVSLYLCCSKDNARGELRALEECCVSSKSSLMVRDGDEGVPGRNWNE